MSKDLHRVKVTDEMDKQLSAYLQSLDIPPTKADIVRLAIAEYLERHGFPVEEIHPQIGGNRS